MLSIVTAHVRAAIGKILPAVVRVLFVERGIRGIEADDLVVRLAAFQTEHDTGPRRIDEAPERTIGSRAEIDDQRGVAGQIPVRCTDVVVVITAPASEMEEA